MIQNFNIVYFKDINLEATVVNIGGCTPDDTIIARDLPTINPCFFLSCDDKGNDVLCAIKTTCGNLGIKLGVTTYIAETAPVTVCDGVFFGGHPVHHYRPK